MPAWSDALMVTVPVRRPLLARKRIPLDERLRYPLVLCDPQVCEGHARHAERVLRRTEMEPLIAERVASCDLMMALPTALPSQRLPNRSRVQQRNTENTPTPCGAEISHCFYDRACDPTV